MRNKSWPFKLLDVGQSCTIPAHLAHRARAYAYAYGGQMGKRFSCKVQPDGALVVTRVAASETRVALTLEEFESLTKTFSKARLREIAPILAGHFKIESGDGQVWLVRREADPA